MPVLVIEDTKEYPVWKPFGKHKTRYCVVTLPEQRMVESGSTVRSIALDLDPGYYRIVCSQVRPYRKGAVHCTKWLKDVYHGITPKQHDRLNALTLRFTKSRMTSDGARYTCELMGCSTEVTSRIAALIHEAEHSGVDILKDDIRQEEIPDPKQDPIAVETHVQEKRNKRVNAIREAALEG